MNLIKQLTLSSEEKAILREHEKLNMAKYVAVNRPGCMKFWHRGKIHVDVEPNSEIRESYFNIFEDLAGGSIAPNDEWPLPPKSIDSLFRFFEDTEEISFRGADTGGSSLTLEYLPESVRLEISSYNPGAKEGYRSREGGIITTYKDAAGKYVTDLIKADDFEYNHGSRANHAISRAIDMIQYGPNEGRFSKEKLENLPGIQRSNLLEK